MLLFAPLVDFRLFADLPDAGTGAEVSTEEGPDEGADEEVGPEDGSHERSVTAVGHGTVSVVGGHKVLSAL